MTVLSELINFSVGAGAFALLALFSMLATGIAAFYLKRPNPGHILAMQALIIASMYAVMATDWAPQYIQRTKDGREAPWTRSITTVVLYASHAISIAGVAHLDQGSSQLVWVLGLFAGMSLGLTDLISWEHGSLYPWLLGCCLLVVQSFFVFFKSQTAYPSVWALSIGSLVFTFAFPIVQMLSWLMAGVLDKNPNREGSEIAFIVVYACLAIYGIFAGVFYVASPPDMMERKMKEPKSN